MKAHQSKVVVAEAKVEGVGEVQGVQVGGPQGGQALVNGGNLGGHPRGVQGNEHGVPAGARQPICQFATIQEFPIA